MKKPTKTLAVAAVAAVSLTLAACGGGGEGSSSAGAGSAAEEILAMPEIDASDGLVIDGEQVADAELLEAAREEGSVGWYTASGAESAEVTAARFEAETGVDVDMTRMPSGKLSERVLSEAGAGRLEAGVVTITDPVLAEEFAEAGVYAPYEVTSSDALADTEGVVYEDGLYYAPYYSAYAFSYNNQVVQKGDAPKDWSDLLDPKWKGKVGIVNAGAGGTVQGLAKFQEELDADYWEKLAAQEPRIFDTTSVQLEALARGEIEVATSGFNSTYGAEVAGAPITLVVPPSGVSGTYNMQGVTEAGLDSAAAKLFQDWTMSTSGQRFAAAQGFVAARTDIPTTRTGSYELPSGDSDGLELYTPEQARTEGADIVARWNRAFGYSG